MGEWQDISTAPEGVQILLFWAEGEAGNGGMECAIIFRGDIQSPTGMSFWTHGGPNGGSDWEPRNSEKPTHWQPLPEPPTASPDTASVVSEDQHRDQSSQRQDGP